AYFDINPNAILESLQAQKPNARGKRPSRKKAAQVAEETALQEAASAAPMSICDMIADASRACPFTGEMSTLGQHCLTALDTFTKSLQ
ncbi:unnamed protein product, partial [Closterium sp. NIES-54]